MKKEKDKIQKEKNKNARKDLSKEERILRILCEIYAQNIL